MLDALCLDTVRLPTSVYSAANMIRGYLHNRTRASNVSVNRGGPRFARDDFHVTLRMGKAETICNLHGHLYMHQTQYTKVPVEMMKDDERMIVSGRARELRIWGPYPAPSREYPRLGGKLPENPSSWVEKGKNYKGKGIDYPIIKYKGR